MATGRLSERYDLFIFDWDGTLNRLRLELRIKDLITLRALRKVLGTKKRSASQPSDQDKVIDLKKREMETNILSFFIDIFIFFSRTRLQKGTLKTMRELNRRGKHVAIFTNAARMRILKEINSVDITRYLEAVVSAREIHAFKPDPKGIELIVKHLGVRRSRVIYMGDMADDIMAAKLAGVASCAIADGFDSYERLRAEKPDYIFRSMEGFLERV